MTSTQTQLTRMHSVDAAHAAGRQAAAASMRRTFSRAVSCLVGRLAVAALLSTAAPAYAQSGAPEEPPAETPMDGFLQDVNGSGMIEVLAFGDSITRGVGDFTSPNEEIYTEDLTFPSGEAGYPLRVERLLGVPVANQGVPGEVLTTAGVVRFARAVPNQRPDFVVISGGTNDAILRTNASDYQRSVQTMLNISYAVGTVPVLATVPMTCCNRSGLLPFINSYNQQLRTLAAVNEIRLADINRAYSNTCVDDDCFLLNRPEGEHPNTAGYDVSGEAVIAALLGINLFAPDGAMLLEQALGLPPGSIRTKPDPVSITPAM